MARKLKLDLTNVESYTRAEEGIHTCKIASIEQTTSQGGDDMLKVVYEVMSGSSKGCKVFDNIVLTEKALWKLKQLLKAVGMKCDGKIALDLDTLEGRICDINVVHEEYNGQLRAKVGDVTPTSSKSKTSDDDDEDDDEEEDDEYEPKKKAPEKPAKKAPPKKPEPEEDDEDGDDEDWEEEDEEEDEPPKKKSAKKPEKKSEKKPAKKPAKKPELEDDDEDWEEVWEEV